MADMVFTKGGDTFTWSCGRRYPIADAGAVNVVVDYSEGRQLYAYDKGVEEDFFYLDMVMATQTDYDNFDEWLKDIVVGPKETFTFTDDAGSNHTVRLMDTKNPLREVQSGRYGGVITLRKEVA